MGCYVVKTRQRQIVNKTPISPEQLLQVANILGIPERDVLQTEDVESILIYLPKPPSSGSP